MFSISDEDNRNAFVRLHHCRVVFISWTEAIATPPCYVLLYYTRLYAIKFYGQILHSPRYMLCAISRGLKCDVLRWRCSLCGLLSEALAGAYRRSSQKRYYLLAWHQDYFIIFLFSPCFLFSRSFPFFEVALEIRLVSVSVHLAWIRPPCDHGCIRSEYVNMRQQMNQSNQPMLRAAAEASRKLKEALDSMKREADEALRETQASETPINDHSSI